MRSEGVAPALFVGASPERRIKRARSPAWIIHAPKLEARRQGGLLLRPRARAGNAAARRPASTSTRPSWKRGGKAACFYVHAHMLETRRQGGQLLRPRPSWKGGGEAGAASLRARRERFDRRDVASGLRARSPAGNAAGKAACFYVHARGWRLRRQRVFKSKGGPGPSGQCGLRPVWDRRDGSPAWIIHAPKLETRRQGGLLLRPRAQAGNAAARRPASIVHAPKLETRRQGGLLLRPRARAGNAAARRPASTSTRPGWKRGGKAACFYVHAPGLETRRQGGLLLRPRAQAGSAAVRWLGLLKKAAGRSPTFWRRSDQRRPRQAEGFGLGWSRGWSGEHSKRQICRLPLVACFCSTAPAAQSAASTAERSPARPPSATRGSSDPRGPSAV